MRHSQKIANQLSISISQVEAVVVLLKEKATIPFIARYRKERTGSLDELQIADIRDLHSKLEEMEKRRGAIMHALEEMELLTPALASSLQAAESVQQLEDIYLPYKPKRRTRAMIAREKGLEPLAKIIMSQPTGAITGSGFINPSKGVDNAEHAIKGAQDIIAEWINEHAFARKRLRKLYYHEAQLTAKVIKKREEEASKYQAWFDWEERASKAPSHRVLAILRGEQEGFLRVAITPEKEQALGLLTSIFVKGGGEAAAMVAVAVEDSYKRLLAPSMENEWRAEMKEQADKVAIDIFAKNLYQLLMEPPLGNKRVLAIDPAFRTGCKVVCLNENGDLLHNETIFPHAPRHETKQAAKKINSLVDAYHIQAIAIGNGTAGRETEQFIKKMRFNKDVVAVMVNENGASVYSASAIAREEFPEYDITVRGAVSIGRRLQDPLAELVKIDPKAIGVGQYQHDVNQTKLKEALEDVVERCVNRVGVNLNSAGKELLSFVSGIGPALAKNIVEYRTKQGDFTSRQQLLNIPRFGEIAFQQSAGFLRIPTAANPLDNSAVHPESYGVVERMAKKLKVEVGKLIGDSTRSSKLVLEEFVTPLCGMPTLEDILKELEKPGRDPRKVMKIVTFDDRIKVIEDLKPGMQLIGVVNNITAFGAFVDVGIKQSGLVHKSNLANQFVTDPNEIVHLGQQVKVKVLDVDIERKRIQLSMKS